MFIDALASRPKEVRGAQRPERAQCGQLRLIIVDCG